MRANVPLPCLDRPGIDLLSAHVSELFLLQWRNPRVENLNGSGFCIVRGEQIEQYRRIGDSEVEVLVH